MKASSKASLLYGCALLCVLSGLPLVYRAIDYAATAGDAAFEPEQVCDKACQQAWNAYGHKGDPWIIAAAIVVSLALVLGVIGRRIRTAQHGPTD